MSTAFHEHLSIAQVAKRLAVNERTIRRAIQAGTLPCKRVGRVIRIDPEDLAVFDYCPEPEVRVVREPRLSPLPRTPVERAARRREAIIARAREGSTGEHPAPGAR